MKIFHILLLLFFSLATVSILAQTPEKMSYEVFLRDAPNTLLTHQQVEIQIRILQTTITGTAVYTETQTATTNINGLVSSSLFTETLNPKSFQKLNLAPWQECNAFLTATAEAHIGCKQY
jgi:hypothetical protein